MSIISTVTVTVPATTANLGPGFDCIGAALTMYNHFQFSQLEEVGTLKISATGAEAAKVKTDDSNLAYQSFVKLYEYLGQSPPSVVIDISLGVPLARGLGSSATAIAAGLVAGNYLAGKPLTQVEVMQLAIAIEGHPDNVVPALLGGCRLAASKEDPPQPPLGKEGLRGFDWEICDIPWHPNIVPVVAIPDFELSTSEARKVLPSDYSRADAIFNAAHLGLLLRGLETGNPDWLRSAMQDKIHQPYRQALIKGYSAVRQAAIAAGAYEMAISGAGPTLLALADADVATAVAAAMAQAWLQQGVRAEVRSLGLDTEGTRITA